MLDTTVDPSQMFPTLTCPPFTAKNDKKSTRRYPQGIQRLVSTHTSHLQNPSGGRGILGNFRTEVPQSSMKSSNLGEGGYSWQISFQKKAAFTELIIGCTSGFLVSNKNRWYL